MTEEINVRLLARGSRRDWVWECARGSIGLGSGSRRLTSSNCDMVGLNRTELSVSESGIPFGILLGFYLMD